MTIEERLTLRRLVDQARREQREKDLALTGKGRCAHCDALFTRIPGSRPRIYCSYLCRKRSWHEQRRNAA